MTGVVYDQVGNYFEIRFPRVDDSEFIKVNTTPLSSGVLPGGVIFDGRIEVSNLQAFFTLAQDEGDEIITQARQFNAGVNYALSLFAGGRVAAGPPRYHFL